MVCNRVCGIRYTTPTTPHACITGVSTCMQDMPRVGDVVVLHMLHVVQQRCRTCAMSSGAIYGAKE